MSDEGRAAGGGRDWTPLQRRLHWLVALLVLWQFALQGTMRAASEAAAAGESIGFGQFVVMTLHTWGGAGIAALVLWRLVLRRRSPVGVGGGALGPLAARLVGWHHALLYALLLAMALSGALHYYVGWAAAGRWHEIGKWILGLAVALHLGGALRHALRPADRTFRRMWPRGGERAERPRDGAE